MEDLNAKTDICMRRTILFAYFIYCFTVSFEELSFYF